MGRFRDDEKNKRIVSGLYDYIKDLDMVREKLDSMKLDAIADAKDFVEDCLKKIKEPPIQEESKTRNESRKRQISNAATSATARAMNRKKKSKGSKEKPGSKDKSGRDKTKSDKNVLRQVS